MLYGENLVELMRDLPLEGLKLNDAQNMTPADVVMVMRQLASTPRTVELRAAALLDDLGVDAVLERAGLRLERLDLRDAERVAGASLAQRALAGRSLPVLRHLDLAGCVDFTSDNLAQLTRGLAPTLQTLDVSGCRKLGNDALEGLIACTHLKRLALRGLWKIEAATVVRVLEACTKLQALNVTQCNRLSGADVLRGLAAYSPDLREFLGGSLAGVDDEVLVAFVSSTAGSALVCLGISYSEITNQGLTAIQKSCPCLQRLDISDCHELTENSVMDMVTAMPQLRICQTKYCKGISTPMQLYIAQMLAGRALGIEPPPPSCSGPPGRRPGNEGTDSCGRAVMSSQLPDPQPTEPLSGFETASPTATTGGLEAGFDFGFVLPRPQIRPSAKAALARSRTSHSTFTPFVAANRCASSSASASASVSASAPSSASDWSAAALFSGSSGPSSSAEGSSSASDCVLPSASGSSMLLSGRTDGADCIAISAVEAGPGCGASSKRPASGTRVASKPSPLTSLLHAPPSPSSTKRPSLASTLEPVSPSSPSALSSPSTSLSTSSPLSSSSLPSPVAHTRGSSSVLSPAKPDPLRQATLQRSSTAKGPGQTEVRRTIAPASSQRAALRHAGAIVGRQGSVARPRPPR